MQKTLDQKLANIHADPSGAKDFILADAKDADMAFGIGAPGLSPESHASELRFRTLAEYRDQIRQVIEQTRFVTRVDRRASNARLSAPAVEHALQRRFHFECRGNVRRDRRSVRQ